MIATVTASSFASALELVREGKIEVQQHAAFAPLYLRKRQGPPMPHSAPPVARNSGEVRGLYLRRVMRDGLSFARDAMSDRRIGTAS